MHGHKAIENRDWTTSYRGPLLIHAGKRVDENCFDADGCLLADYWRSGSGDELVAALPQHRQEYETGGIVGIATVVDVVTRSESPGFSAGMDGSESEARPLPFVPYRGQLGLFRIPVSALPAEYARAVGEPRRGVRWVMGEEARRRGMLQFSQSIGPKSCDFIDEAAVLPLMQSVVYVEMRSMDNRKARTHEAGAEGLSEKRSL
jgi:hypothetical protein